MMTYQIAAQFAQTWGLLYALAIFAAIVAYALWPANKATFDRAARMPLDEEKSDV
jgi:cytochrome c oxidase cbb3-type subunit IV